MEKNNYIVPIYKGQDFFGTGFFIGNTLITAGHVVDLPTLSYSCLWGSETISLSCNNLLWHEYYDDYEQGQDNKYWDLAMYYVKGIESPLELLIPKINVKCDYWGYSFDENNRCLKFDSYNGITLKDNARYYPRYGGKPLLIKNCYLSKVGMCKEGNSGGPLFQGGKVVGMLSGNQSFSDSSMDRYIKSEYIMSVLNYINNKKKIEKSY